MDTIKSYLISLGFNVDSASYNKMRSTLKKLDNDITEKSSNMAKNYVAAGSAIVTAIAGITTATVHLLDKLSHADLGYQKFALRMFMARDAAKEFKIVTDAMNESPIDIAWIPELREHYGALMEQARALRLPEDSKGQLRYLREIRHEFNRLKVEASYGFQHVGYHLFKYLIEPITEVREGLKKFNDWIVSKLPEWSQKIAKVLSNLYGIGKSTAKAIGEVAKGLKDLFDQFPEWEKKLIGLGVIITAVFVMGPFGRALAIIGLLVAAIDDFYGAVEGKETLLPIEVYWGFAASLDAVAKAAMGAYLTYKLLSSFAMQTAAKVAFKLESPFVTTEEQRATETRKEALARRKEHEKGVAVGLRAIDQAAEEERDFTWNMMKDIYKKGGPSFGDRLGPDFFKSGEERKAATKKFYASQPETPVQKEAQIQKGLANIAKQESRGDYEVEGQEIPGRGKAIGKYQIMPKNWDEWGEETGLGRNAPRTPENQEKIAYHEYAKLYEKYKSNSLVAAAWYGGESVADELQAGAMSALKTKPQEGVKGPTVGEYIQQTQGNEYSPVGVQKTQPVPVGVQKTPEETTVSVEPVGIKKKIVEKPTSTIGERETLEEARRGESRIPYRPKEDKGFADQSFIPPYLQAAPSTVSKHEEFNDNRKYNFTFESTSEETIRKIREVVNQSASRDSLIGSRYAGGLAP